jgi:hypothetical protein
VNNNEVPALIAAGIIAVPVLIAWVWIMARVSRGWREASERTYRANRRYAMAMQRHPSSAPPRCPIDVNLHQESVQKVGRCLACGRTR